jgi:hypothetical protein
MLIIGLMYGQVRASGKEYWSKATGGVETVGPIGAVYSPGSVEINGRIAYGQQNIWGGELLTVSDTSTALIQLDSVARIMLKGGTSVRFAISALPVANDRNHRILIASVITGQINVYLQQNACAYIESGTSSVMATDGAAFGVNVFDGSMRVNVESGSVEAAPPGIQRVYILEPVNVDPVTGSPLGRRSSNFKVAPNGKTQIPIRVKDQNGRPGGPGRRVRIALGKPGVGEIGSQVVTVLTNDSGVAIATFQAGPNQDSTPVTAIDEESGASWKGHIVVAKPPGIFRTRNILLMGAAAGALIVVISTHGDPGPIRQEPPPIIR